MFICTHRNEVGWHTSAIVLAAKRPRPGAPTSPGSKYQKQLWLTEKAKYKKSYIYISTMEEGDHHPTTVHRCRFVEYTPAAINVLQFQRPESGPGSLLPVPRLAVSRCVVARWRAWHIRERGVAPETCCAPRLWAGLLSPAWIPHFSCASADWVAIPACRFWDGARAYRFARRRSVVIAHVLALTPSLATSSAAQTGISSSGTL